MPIVGSFAGASARAYGAGTGAPALIGFNSIATTTLTGNQLQIDFDNIPQKFKHLQLRAFVRNSEATTDSETTFRFNDDAGTNYSTHYLRGYQTGFDSGNTANRAKGRAGYNPGSSSNANVFGIWIMDILDYQDTNKFKTTRTFNGYNNNGNGAVWIISSNWRSTSAITKISLTADNQAGRNFVQYSSFALYGIEG